MTKKPRRGISPVIATVIIVAVAIAIAIAVAGWIMGLWGGFGKTESLKVFPDSYADEANNKLVLHIQNVGGSTLQIYKIEVSGQELKLQDSTDINVISGTATVNVPTGGGAPTITINPGDEATIEILLDTDADGTANIDVAAGVAYSVTIYTEAGNVYTATVYGK